jgi:hypothetical protein
MDSAPQTRAKVRESSTIHRARAASAISAALELIEESREMIRNSRQIRDRIPRMARVPRHGVASLDECRSPQSPGASGATAGRSGTPASTTTVEGSTLSPARSEPAR